MEIGSKRSNIQYSIYRKAIEMVAHNKLNPNQLEADGHILRLEVRLKEDKLVHYLGNERNVEEIDGEMRLVKFYPHECVAGHRASFSDLKGVYHSDEPLAELTPKEQLTPLGRLLARVARDPRTSLTFQELRHHLNFYTGADTDTLRGIRNAGIEYLSHLSTITNDELFSDAAYRAQYSIASEKKEKDVRHCFKDTYYDPLISAAYCPPDQPFLPLTEWPSYLQD
jgi:hypothetical protein